MTSVCRSTQHTLWCLQCALAKVLFTMRCQTHWLTCVRCLRYAVQRPDLPQLESGPHFMTAVCVHVDHTRRKYEQNPNGSARVYAWAYSSGHCRISHQVSFVDKLYCSRTANCVTVLKIDGTQVVQWSDDEFKHLTKRFRLIVHIIGWGDECERLTAELWGSSLGQRQSGVGWSQSVPLSTLCSGRLSACLVPKPGAHSPPFLFTSAKCPN